MRPTVDPAAPIAPPGDDAARGAGAHLQAVLNSYSEVLFLRGPALGLLVLAVTLSAPSVALAGLVAVLAAYGFARLIRMDARFLQSGFYTYNPLLTGLSLGFLFRPAPLTFFFVVTAGIAAFILTHTLFSAAWYYLRLPVLSLPFVLTGSTAYLAAGSFTNLYVTGLYPRGTPLLDTALPLWLGGFFRALGATFFVPSVLAGLLIAAALLVRSRIAFLLAVGGYYTGTLALAALGGSPSSAFQNPNAFNFILIAIALGGVFLVPSPRSYLLAGIAVLTSTVLLSASEVFWSRWGIPVFALPFNLVTLTFVYSLRLVEYPGMARALGTPEEILDEQLTHDLRFPGSPRTLTLPFAGRWTVWQGFDGPWTHQGAWRYAYDFVVTDDAGGTFREDGTRLEHYHAWRKPVLAPVRGRVRHVVDGLADNPPGSADRAHNWGNLVVIEAEHGWHVELSHFAQGSVRVREGDWVERGALLGLCGNSGYSPQPHIHVQVQESERVGAPTLPFSFVSYAAGDRYHGNDRPAVGTRVESLPPEAGMESRLGFVLDETYRFRVRQRDPLRFPDATSETVTFTVCMAPNAAFQLRTDRGSLDVAVHHGTWVAERLSGSDPYLRALLLALPSVPLVARPGLTWQDHVPAGAVCTGARRAAIRLLRSVAPGVGMVTVRLAFVDRDTVVGQILSPLVRGDLRTRVVLHAARGFTEVHVGDLILVRDDATT